MRRIAIWMMILLMLSASFCQAARPKELAVRLAPGQAARGAWQLRGRMALSGKPDAREEKPMEHLLEHVGGTVKGAAQGPRLLLILLGLSGFDLSAFFGRTKGRKRFTPPREPVHMRAVRHMHFAYGL